MVQTNEKRSGTNEIYIGNKPFMKYVIATMMQLKENDSAVIRARGKFISRGVDVVEVVKKRIQEAESVELNQTITTGTEGFKNDEGKHINVSTIDIVLKR
ncbi:RNA-binding protein [Candidatus Pacearchaeota archaeon CG10_big_fil_rev_8_21_14_0_10_30_48]|nr:MAG: RNA-binding protein [Candidatus Pacearchaeota archaeon CG10_big_fil_rev_8_21_14_0_10_30_48]